MSCQTSLEPLKEFIQLINHLLRRSVVLLCGLEAWCVVCRCRCCSAFLSISSCFFQRSAPSLCSCRLTRVQICFQLSVTHSAGRALVFGSVCPLSAYLSWCHLLPYSPFLHLPPSLLFQPYLSFFTTSRTPFKHLLSLSYPFFFSLSRLVPGVNQ